MSRPRGAALVLVLWLIALLTALVGAFALNARIEHMQGRVLGDLAQGQERARAGLEYGLYRLQGTALQPAWQADGRRYRWNFQDQRVDIRIIDERGKVDLNLADLPLLQALLQAVGVEPAQAQRLAGAIIDWRDADDLSPPGGGAEAADYQQAGLPYVAKNARFESVGELQRVLGIEPALYETLVPLVTLYAQRSRPDPAYAAGPVLTALGLDATQVLAQRQLPLDPAQPVGAPSLGHGTYSVESRAQLAPGREAVLRAVVRVGDQGFPGAAYAILRWEEGAVAR